VPEVEGKLNDAEVKALLAFETTARLAVRPEIVNPLVVSVGNVAEYDTSFVVLSYSNTPALSWAFLNWDT